MKKGISLAVLVVTIIVLVILTAATMATINGENGVIDEARLAANDTKRQNAEDKVYMEMAAVQIKAAKASQTVYEYLTDAEHGTERKIELESKLGGTVTLEENQITCIVNQQTINVDTKGNIIKQPKVSTLAGTTWKFNTVLNNYDWMATLDYEKQVWSPKVEGYLTAQNKDTLEEISVNVMHGFGIVENSLNPTNGGDMLLIVKPVSNNVDIGYCNFKLENQTYTGWSYTTNSNVEAFSEQEALIQYVGEHINTLGTIQPTITFTGGEDVTNQQLIDWMYANATLIS